MADYNWSTDSLTTASISASEQDETVGSAANIKDGSASTYVRVRGQLGSSGGEVSVTGTVTFSKDVNLTSVFCKLEADGYSRLLNVTLKNSSGGTIATLANTTSEGTINQTFTGTWSNVRSIVARAVCVYAEGQTGYAWIYELDGFGVNYLDKGLRARVAGATKSVAVQTLDAHAVRVRIGGTTYGVPVVATNAGSASPIRVRIGGATKALVYYT